MLVFRPPLVPELLDVPDDGAGSWGFVEAPGLSALPTESTAPLTVSTTPAMASLTLLGRFGDGAVEPVPEWLLLLGGVTPPGGVRRAGRSSTGGLLDGDGVCAAVAGAVDGVGVCAESVGLTATASSPEGLALAQHEGLPTPEKSRLARLIARLNRHEPDEPSDRWRILEVRVDLLHHTQRIRET